ncbi:hypothetical protein [Streptomyces sp. NPDC002588]|uniref:hypothetical protein n=1 Tax=Streptomyces sp. NPDC002588 TaxID=3154419 RepID=UPI00332EF60A
MVKTRSSRSSPERDGYRPRESYLPRPAGSLGDAAVSKAVVGAFGQREPDQNGYWREVYYPLQPQLNLMLVNPSHLKGIRGRKSDPSDAAFLARASASGMAMGSFVPGREILSCGI